jgi:hypothetical protein
MTSEKLRNQYGLQNKSGVGKTKFKTFKQANQW